MDCPIGKSIYETGPRTYIMEINLLYAIGTSKQQNYFDFKNNLSIG